MKKETIAISRYPKHWNRNGIERVYQVWYHQWIVYPSGERERVHHRVYPTHKAELFCNSYNAEQFILAVKKYPLAYTWYQPKFGDRLSIRSYKRYFIEIACSQANRLGSIENLNVTKIQKNPEKDVEYYVTMFFTSYKDGCKWIKDHYKEYQIINVGAFKNYLLELTKGE
jgi:hypothetical protein